MKLDKRVAYLQKVLLTAQRARSILLEMNGEDAAALTVMEDLEPWLFGKMCIIPALAKKIEAPEDIDVLNFSAIVGTSPMLQVAGVQYGLGELDILDIFNGEK
jgi:hypothetical protein